MDEELYIEGLEVFELDLYKLGLNFFSFNDMSRKEFDSHCRRILKENHPDHNIGKSKEVIKEKEMRFKEINTIVSGIKENYDFLKSKVTPEVEEYRNRKKKVKLSEIFEALRNTKFEFEDISF